MSGWEIGRATELDVGRVERTVSVARTRVVAIGPEGGAPRVAVVVEMAGEMAAEKSKRRVPDPSGDGLDIGRKRSSRVAEVWVGDVGTGRVWASWRDVGVRFEEDTARAEWRVLINTAGALIELAISGLDGRAGTIVGEDGERLVERWMSVRVDARVRVGSEPHRFESALGMIEHVDIAVAPGASWSSALLLGTPACYVTDLGDGRENAAWTDEGVRGLMAGELALAEPGRPGRGPWTVKTRDGRVALGFSPRLVCIGRSGATCVGTFDGAVEGKAVNAQVGLCDARVVGG